MNWQLTTDRDVNEYKNIVRTRLNSRTIRELQNPGYRNAAVMMLIMNEATVPSVLLTVRTNSVSTHKGEVSFPGGGFDDEDTDLYSTALRETEEEVGIDRTVIEYLGRFDDYISIFGYHVTSFIGWIDFPFEYKMNENEISRILNVPIKLFADKCYDHYEEYPFEGKKYKIYHYFYNNAEIWGLTARILTDFGSEICKP